MGRPVCHLRAKRSARHPSVSGPLGAALSQRRLRELVSHQHIAFVRASQHEWLGPNRSREGEQNHEGISVWNRGNVLLGIYGRWHGAAEWKDVRSISAS
jgi:hypothetical protein